MKQPSKNNKTKIKRQPKSHITPINRTERKKRIKNMVLLN